MRKIHRIWLRVIAMAIVFGVVSCLGFKVTDWITDKYIFSDNHNTEEEELAEQTELAEPVPAEAGVSILEDITSVSQFNTAEENTVASVAAECMPSIVAITSISIQEIRSFYGYGVREYPTSGSGSGIVVGENDEEILIATNNHVVEGAQKLNIFFVGSDVNAGSEDLGIQNNNENSNIENAISAQVKGTDADNDLAVVAVRKEDIPADTMEQIRFAKIGNSDSLVVGEQVVAIGNALGYGQSVTSGWISALNRSMYMDDGQYAELIQTDAAINPGNSGGALLNMRGELIGINSAKYASSGVEGMGYAIPISKAEPILEELMNRKTRTVVADDKAAYLGVTTADLTSAAIMMYNMPQGVFIYEVVSGGPAEQAGLQRGDILIEMDGMKVNDKSELTDRMRYFEAGETIDVVIERQCDGEYQKQTLSVTMGSKQELDY